MEDYNNIWNFNKRKRELTTEVQFYENFAQREINQNELAIKLNRKTRTNYQRYLQWCYEKYKNHTGENYPNPKFPITAQ